jgi:hypothetical protein
VQLGGVAGILACVLLVSAGIVTSNTLSADASTAQITHYLTSNRSGVLTQTVLDVAGSALSLWFGATLARLLHVRDRHSPLGLIVLAAGVGMTAIASLDGLTLTALEFVSKQGGLTDPSVIRTFYDLQSGIIMPGAFGCIAAVFLASVGAAMVRRVFAAPWVGWLSFALAGLSVVSSVVGLTITNGGTSALGFFPAIGFVLITFISSIFMLREPGEGVGSRVAPTASIG